MEYSPEYELVNDLDEAGELGGAGHAALAELLALGVDVADGEVRAARPLLLLPLHALELRDGI